VTTIPHSATLVNTLRQRGKRRHSSATWRPNSSGAPQLSRSYVAATAGCWISPTVYA
jgi:hypothetical protein